MRVTIRKYLDRIWKGIRHSSSQEESLPGSFFRGLRSPKWVVEEKFVSGAAFEPDYRTRKNRDDSGAEVSINWEDDDTVLGFTFQDRNKTAAGIARVNRADFERVNQQLQQNQAAQLLLERNEVKGNPYHGNIVYPSGMSKAVDRMAMAAIAFAATYIPRRD